MRQAVITHTHTHTEDGVVDLNASGNYYQIILMLVRTGTEGETGETRGRERQTSLFIWGIEGG